MEKNIDLTEAQVKLKVQQLMNELESAEPNHEIGRKLYFTKNFLFNYFGREAVNDECKDADSLSTDYVYVSFENIKSAL
jgi:hypothetical protein